MTTFALIMAGGRGERMRRSAGPENEGRAHLPAPKPLVPIRGVPLLERNIINFLHRGFRDVAVTISSSDDEIRAFALTRGRSLAGAFGARLHILEEERPLGNAGAAGLLRGIAQTVVLSFADNLTTLDLQAMLADHLQSGAAMTLATHEQAIRVPFGELRLDGDRVAEYIEKPVYPVSISSGLSILGPRAMAAIPEGQPVGLSALAESLVAAGYLVRAFPHAAPWIDVNDMNAAAQAEALLAAESAFECWAERPDGYAAPLLLWSDNHVLLERQPDPADTWTLPFLVRRQATPPGPGPWPPPGVLRFHDFDPAFVAAFDEVDTVSGEVVRHYVYRADTQRPSCEQGPNAAWAAVGELPGELASAAMNRLVPRSLAVHEAERRRQPVETSSWAHPIV